MAIFEIEGNVTSYLDIKKDTTPSDEGLFLFGYPKGKFMEMKQTGKVYDHNYHYVFSVDQSNLPGASGSPVFNAEKQVIGILVQVVVNHVITVQSNYLQELIKEVLGSNCANIHWTVCVEKERNNLKKLAEQGDVYAQYVLGTMYSKGMGGTKKSQISLSIGRKGGKTKLCFCSG